MKKYLFNEYKNYFDENGFVLFKQAINRKTLSLMNSQLQDWVNQSKKYKNNYGSILDGRPRFDVEPNSHSKENPALRRISSPIEISDTFLAFTRNNPALDLITHIFSHLVQ